MAFIVIIPARLASTRLPGKPLADLGGKPMVVRVAEQAALSGAARVIVATDHESIRAACAAHGVEACMTRSDHPSGTDRIAEVARTLALPPDAVVVNLQGDEPLIDPSLLAACAAQISAAVPMATCAHPLHDVADAFNPNVVKVVLDKNGRALYFSRATIPCTATALRSRKTACRPATCRCAISACMPTAMRSCKRIPACPRRRWKRSRRWSSCASCGMAMPSPCT